MRTLLAAFSLVMLVGAGFGCGDDSTTTTGADMAVGLDMTATVKDMSTLTCGQILQCAQSCTTQTCVGACIAEGKSTSQTKATALFQCALGACASDGGVDTTCVGGVIQQASSGAGPCGSQGTACFSDTGM